MIFYILQSPPLTNLFMNEDLYNNRNENCHHLTTLYTDTSIQMYNQHMQTPKPTSFPTFVKDVTKPFTYHTVSSCANANNYYVNFDNYECNNGGNQNNQENPSFETSGCVKTYLCGLFGCLLCSFYHCKPF